MFITLGIGLLVILVYLMIFWDNLEEKLFLVLPCLVLIYFAVFLWLENPLFRRVIIIGSLALAFVLIVIYGIMARNAIFASINLGTQLPDVTYEIIRCENTTILNQTQKENMELPAKLLNETWKVCDPSCYSHCARVFGETSVETLRGDNPSCICGFEEK